MALRIETQPNGLFVLDTETNEIVGPLDFRGVCHETKHEILRTSIDLARQDITPIPQGSEGHVK